MALNKNSASYSFSYLAFVISVMLSQIFIWKLLCFFGTSIWTIAHQMLKLYLKEVPFKSVMVSVCIFYALIYHALSGDFQCTCGKMHVRILLGMQWCAMSIFLLLKFYNFNKRIMCIYSIFKKLKTNVFKCHLSTF